MKWRLADERRLIRDLGYIPEVRTFVSSVVPTMRTLKLSSIRLDLRLEGLTENICCRSVIDDRRVRERQFTITAD